MPGRLGDPPPGFGRRVTQRLGRPGDPADAAEGSRTEPEPEPEPKPKTEPEPGEGVAAPGTAEDEGRWEDRTWAD